VQTQWRKVEAVGVRSDGHFSHISEHGRMLAGGERVRHAVLPKRVFSDLLWRQCRACSVLMESSWLACPVETCRKFLQHTDL
jgi:hypothetical protein